MERCIKEYCVVLGQLVNIEKSSIIFSENVSGDVKGIIKKVLGVKAARNPGTYLGIPSL